MHVVGLAPAELRAGATCKVPWGSKADAYDAEVVVLHRAPAYRLHYLTIGDEWDQWVAREKIIRQMRQ